MTAEQFESWLPAHTKATNEALLAVARGADRATVENALVAARAKVEQWRPIDDDISTNIGELALIDAFLGRKEEAIAECRRHMEQVKRDIFMRNQAAAHLALVYARTGETDKAINLIENLRTVPMELNNWLVTAITLADLKWRWVWDPRRKDPRFQKILARPEPKTIY